MFVKACMLKEFGMLMSFNVEDFVRISINLSKSLVLSTASCSNSTEATPSKVRFF